MIIIGGGVSKKIEQFESYLKIKTPLKAAELKNNAGIVGAALFAKKEDSKQWLRVEYSKHQFLKQVLWI